MDESMSGMTDSGNMGSGSTDSLPDLGFMMDNNRGGNMGGSPDDFITYGSGASAGGFPEWAWFLLAVITVAALIGLAYWAIDRQLPTPEKELKQRYIKGEITRLEYDTELARMTAARASLKNKGLKNNAPVAAGTATPQGSSPGSPQQAQSPVQGAAGATQAPMPRQASQVVASAQTPAPRQSAQGTTVQGSPAQAPTQSQAAQAPNAPQQGATAATPAATQPVTATTQPTQVLNTPDAGTHNSETTVLPASHKTEEES